MSEWISVKDRLPKEDGEYTVYLHNTKSPSGYAAVQSLSYSALMGEGWLISGYTVTHWMPLPEPPKDAA